MALAKLITLLKPSLIGCLFFINWLKQWVIVRKYILFSFNSLLGMQKMTGVGIPPSLPNKP